MSHSIDDGMHTLKDKGDQNLVTGTVANDTLDGTAGNDKINGDAGDDILTDTLGGNDILLGGAGNDSITVGRDAASTDDIHILGGFGDDTVTFNGAAGNQVTLSIDAGSGANIVEIDHAFQVRALGGNDADTFTVSTDHYALVHTAGGDDTVNVSSTDGTARTGVSTGDGVDTVNLSGDNDGHYRMRLGEGQDVVNVAASTSGHDVATASEVKLVFFDFQAGDSGDQVNLQAYLNSVLSHDFHGDLFATHHLQLVNGVTPDGDAAAYLEMDLDGDKNGADWVKLAVFIGVDAADITSFNLGGIDPVATPASDGLVI